MAKDKQPLLYRRDLLHRAKAARYGLGFRDIARYTELSVGTVQQAFDGDAAKVTTLWVLARYFGIPWLAMFDIECKFTIVPRPPDESDRPGTIRLRDEDGLVIGAVDPSLITAMPATPKKSRNNGIVTAQGAGRLRDAIDKGTDRVMKNAARKLDKDIKAAMSGKGKKKKEGTK